MPDRRRQENKKPEPGLLPKPNTRPGAAVVGSTSAGVAVTSSSVSTRSPSRSHPVPATNTNIGIPVAYRSSNTVHHFGTAQQTQPTLQPQQTPQVTQQSPQIQQPLFETGYFQIPQLRLNFSDSNNLPGITIFGNHNGQAPSTTTSPSIPNPGRSVQTHRRNPSFPPSQARGVVTATAYPNPIASTSNSSTGRLNQHQPNPLYHNGFGSSCPPGRRPNLYPCGPEVLVGLGQQHEYQQPHGQITLSPNSLIAHAKTNHAFYHQQFDCIPIPPDHSNGINSSQPLQYQPLIPDSSNSVEVKREILANSNAINFAQLHHLSCLAAKRSAEERESLNQTRSAFFAVTDVSENQRDLIFLDAHNRPRARPARMANGVMRVKQETLNCSSPEDSGDQVLDLRKSTAEKVCVWCGKKSSVGEDGVESEFCSEICFDQYRRDSFKKRAACMWCNNANHGTINLSLISTLDESKFCSDQCLTQFKVRLFCEETSAHLEQLKEIQQSRSSHSTPRQSALPLGNELITPELWLRKQHPNSKKGSSGDNVSSPHQTISSGCNSPMGSPQSSQHSNSPTIVPNPHHIQNHRHKVTAQVSNQIFPTLTNDGASNGLRRRVISPPDRNAAPSAAKEKSTGPQKKRFKSSSSASTNSVNILGLPVTSQALQQHLLMTATASQGMIGNGNNNVVNNAHHSRSRKSNASFTMTSGTPIQLVSANQIPISGSPRHAVTLTNGNGISPLIQPGFLSGLIANNQNQVTPSLAFSPAAGFHLSTENGFSSSTANGAANFNHNHTVVTNPTPLSNPIQLSTILSPRPAGNPTGVSISTQTEPSISVNQNMTGGDQWNNFGALPPVTVLVPFPIPFPLPIPIPIFLGDFANWGKNFTKESPVPTTSGNEKKVETAVSDTKIKEEVLEDDEMNKGVDETVEEGEIVGNSEEETIDEQKTPTDAKPSDTKTD